MKKNENGLAGSLPAKLLPAWHVDTLHSVDFFDLLKNPKRNPVREKGENMIDLCEGVGLHDATHEQYFGDVVENSRA